MAVSIILETSVLQTTVTVERAAIFLNAIIVRALLMEASAAKPISLTVTVIAPSSIGDKFRDFWGT